MITRVATAFLLALTLVAAVAGCSDASSSENRPLVMGAADTPVMTMMAQIYAGALRNSGTAVSSTVRTGDYPKLLDEMDTADVDLFPAYTGQLLTQLAPQLTPVTADDVFKDLNKSLPQGVSVGDATMVSAAPQVVVATRVADADQVTDLADCARLPAGLPVVVSGTPDESVLHEFAAAGCRFGPVESVSSADDVVARVAGGRALGIVNPLDLAGDQASDDQSASPSASGQTAGDQTGNQAATQHIMSEIRVLRVAAPATTTKGGTATSATAVVVGPRAQDLVPIYRTAAFSRDQVKTINKVAGELTTADLATLTKRAIAGEHPSDLAGEWLAEHGL